MSGEGVVAEVEAGEKQEDKQGGDGGHAGPR